MRSLRYFIYLFVALAVILGGSSAAAHPLGNFTINHYAGLQIQPDQLKVGYVLDMAEIPAFQAIHQMDTNQNRIPDPAEMASFQPEACDQIRSALTLELDQHRYPLTLASSNLEFPEGVGGLSTLRLSCDFETPLDLSVDQHQLYFSNQAYDKRLGWREITLTTDIPTQSDLSHVSLSQQLRAYPDDLLKSPPDQRQATITLWPALATTTEPTSTFQVPQLPFSLGLGGVSIGRGQDPFTRLITLEDLTPITMSIALAIAFIWGGFHALTPGHGKTIVGAYLVGSRGTPQHALLLGLTTTVTHTAGIFTLGLLTLAVAQFRVTEQIYPWLSTVSGLIVISIGVTLFRQRLAHLGDHDHHDPHHHDPHHDHHHHDPHHHHHDDHEHTDLHPHHPTHAHSHPDDKPKTWLSLIALGISGGLLPCPTALVVLLSAIALGRIGFGLALVTSFSLGLAFVLTSLGLLVIYARHWVEKMSLAVPQTKFLPTMSAAVIVVVGTVITTQALMQTGMLHL